ncbi:NUT family member 2D-like [Trichechus manatus latirostris]|uniref:NUT family member 2D-like n=1 Tax=Trichechus manatus latirostris TaxID=127582 RepID=A0A2Y9QJ15_TRIMA|nr:NUT family member 2D-like [Trichechus manatus latirostris]
MGLHLLWLSSTQGCFKAQSPNKHQQRPQCPWEPKRPNEIPPKAVKGYTENMEAMLGSSHSATVEPNEKYEEENEQQQQETGIYLDPGILHYTDKLCSQEEFITKVETVIYPQFLEILLSPESQVDPMSLRQELEQEEGLTPTQLVDKQLLELKGKVGVEAHPT